MQNFTYVNPTKIHFGEGAILKLGEELKALCVERALLVYGKASIFANGVHDAVMQQMATAGVEVVEHGGVQGNPVLSHTRAGIEKARHHEVDAICAVGGGSVIDEAKAICAGVNTNVDVWDLFTMKASPGEVLPLLAVCTLPATGSEMNGICVVTNEETKEKIAMVKPGALNPKVSFLDPEVTKTLTAEQTAFACTDILSHIMEAYFTTSAKRLPLQDNLLEGVAKATVEAMDLIMAHPDDYDARAAFMWAATMAWSGIAQAGIPGPSMPCHALEMPLSAVYDIAHGAGLSVVIPAWIRHSAKGHLSRIAAFAKAVFKVDACDAASIASALRVYYRRIGSPVTFVEAGIAHPDMDRLVQLASASLAQRGMTDYTPKVVRAIYNECME
ncbi:MAG: iron-containing alcohol dehydrogenase [Deltaproteobacteria bacterium]|nr:iron-containing alcohol dehydrogenase [Deltaproteobacteria bacterium]